MIMNDQFLFLLILSVSLVIGSPVDNDKPAFSCPARERYEKCSQVICYKKCTHLRTPPACPSVSTDCFNPACECEEDYLRNDYGVCIRVSECPEYIKRESDIEIDDIV